MRLHQTGVDVKLIKEITGHVSDAVHKYQTMSTDQKMHMSSIIQRDVTPIKLSQEEPMAVVKEVQKSLMRKIFKLPKFKLPIQSSKVEENAEGNTQNVREVIEGAIKAVSNRHAKIQVDVELLD